MRFTIRDLLWLMMVVAAWMAVSVWYGRENHRLRLKVQSEEDLSQRFLQRTDDLYRAIHVAGYDAVEDYGDGGLILVPLKPATDNALPKNAAGENPGKLPATDNDP
jgi:hypothetical protein